MVIADITVYSTRPVADTTRRTAVLSLDTADFTIVKSAPQL